MRFICSVFGLALITAGAVLAGSGSSEIEKFFRVNEQVCTGAQPTREQLASLKADGVRGIINLREPEEHNIEEEATLAKDLGLLYVSIPRKDRSTEGRAGGGVPQGHP